VSDEALRDVYARIMRDRDATGRAGAVSVEAMQALLERRGPEADRVKTLDSIMRDHDARADFEILRAAYEAAPARSASLPMPVPYAIAAALVLMIGSGVWLRSRAPSRDVERGSSAALSVVSPAGSVPAGAPVRFVWHTLAGATAYVLQVVDADGGVSYMTTTPDTAVVLPDSVRLSAEKAYRWWVEARRPTGETVKSAVQPLRSR
jgi:hypothetical protein